MYAWRVFLLVFNAVVFINTHEDTHNTGKFSFYKIRITNKIHSFCQASTIDGRRKGACLFCQEYFMDLYLLAELKTISLKASFSYKYCEKTVTNNLALKCFQTKFTIRNSLGAFFYFI